MWKRTWNKKQLQLTIRRLTLIDPETGCWIWLRTAAGNGRPQLRIGGRYEVAAKISLYAFRGIFDRGRKKQAQHTCDTPTCVNPFHLYRGTPKQNVMDAIKRGRWKPYGKIMTVKQ